MHETLRGVQAFTEAFEIPHRSTPGMPERRSDEVLRVQLIGEETSELADAFCAGSLVKILDALTDIEYVVNGGFIIHGLQPKPGIEQQFRRCAGSYSSPRVPQEVMQLSMLMQLHNNLVGYIRGCYLQDLGKVQKALDNLLHVTFQAFLECGLWHVRMDAYREVQRSNMSKLGPDGRPVLSASGRVVKGPNYTPPDLQRVLSAYTEGS